MKSLLLPALIAAAFLSACQTLNNPDQVKRIGNITYTVAKTGTAATLIAKPEYRPAFEQARNALTALIATDSADLPAVQAVLSSIGVDALQGADGTILIEGGIVIYELASGLFFDPQSREGIIHITTRLRDGIADALETGSVRYLNDVSRDTRARYPARTPGNTRPL